MINVWKFNLLFVQPGAKINTVCYCDNILKQGLLPDIRHLSNNNFPFQQDRARAHHSLHTLMCLSSLNQKTGRQTVRN